MHCIGMLLRIVVVAIIVAYFFNVNGNDVKQWVKEGEVKLMEMAEQKR